jgi:hypothetical protein
MRHRPAILAVAVIAGLTVGPWLLAVAAAQDPVQPTQVTLPTIPALSTTTTAPSPPPPTSAPPAETTTSSLALVPATTLEVTTTTAETTTTTTEAAITPPVTPVPPPTVVQRRPGVQVTTAPVIQAASVTGSYGVGVGTVLLFVLILIGFVSHTTSGGSLMSNQQRRWRLIGGVVALASAAVVGIVGYLRLSLEPAVNRQIPYLASAGMALVLLAAIGASLIVAEQLRADDNRLDELEAAVRQLADALAPSIEAPARRGRSAAGAGPVAQTEPVAEPGPGADAEPVAEPGPVAETEPVAQTEPAPPRRRRSSR